MNVIVQVQVQKFIRLSPISKITFINITYIQKKIKRRIAIIVENIHINKQKKWKGIFKNQSIKLN